MRGEEVTIVATYSGGGVPFYELQRTVELVTLAEVIGTTSKGIRSYAGRLMALRRLIAAHRPDVIVSFLPNVNVAAILAKAFLPVPLIVCERNDPSSRSSKDIWEVACRITYRHADMLTVQTDAVAVKARRLYPGLANISVVANPLSEELMAIVPADKSHRRVLLSMGRLAEQKQMDKLVAAFTPLAQRFPDWDLHIYGEGPLKPLLERQIEASGLQGRVSLKGNTREPWKVMAGADAFAMTSKHEGFPNALLEAMGVGLPCVVTDCPSGPREISADGRDALLVPLEDNHGLVEALASLMGNEELRITLGSRARQSVLRRFGLDVVLRRWDELFHAVGARRHRKISDQLSLGSGQQ
jgi:glycosyltransferase involved in cell wall biosynthesis